MSSDRAEIALDAVKGTLVVDRQQSTATVFAPDTPAPDEIVHPCLWPAAAVVARWLGRETFHAGAFLDDDGHAWGVLGDSGDGKSSLLATLALAGHPVLVDDLLVVEGRACFAGPRCVDLHPDMARALGIWERTAAVRSTSRRRLALPPIAGRVPLRGWVHLERDEQVAVHAMKPAERIPRLARHRRVVALGVDPVALLDLARLPALALRWPRRRNALPAARRTLMSALARPALDWA